MQLFLDTWSIFWSVVGIAVAVVIFVELGPDAWRALSRRLRHGAVGKHDYRALADAYEGAEWPKPYFRDLWTMMAVEWAPLVGWRQKPCRTEHFNFDADGLRETVNPPAVEGSKPVSIFMFGGSTTVGVGARDGHTLASCLSAVLNETGAPAHITNCAQLGHSSSQEVIAFHQVLKSGKRPDLVIFYDGANEVIPTEQTGRADSLFNEHHRYAEFNLLHASRRGDLIKAGLAAMVPRLLRRISRLTGWRYRSLQDVSQLPGISEERIPTLARDVSDAYCANVDMALALAESHGIGALFFLQPMLMTKKAKSPHEERYIFDGAPKKDIRHPFFTAAFACMKDAVKARGGVSVDLTHIFDDIAAPIYIDPFHVSERGNRMIAEAMAPYVRDAIARRTNKD